LVGFENYAALSLGLLASYGRYWSVGTYIRSI
ncbi:unnamed protein product, partial [Allacma fusca]